MLVIAALLGIPLWLILGALILLLWQRYQFKHEPDVFELKLRLKSGEADGFKEQWPRVSGYGHWVHDVLLVHEGLGLRTNVPVPVVALEGPLEEPGLEDAKRLGDDPLLYQMTLDNGAILQMGVPSEARPLAAGPFPRPAR